jgi:hypothetical protein
MFSYLIRTSATSLYDKFAVYMKYHMYNLPTETILKSKQNLHIQCSDNTYTLIINPQNQLNEAAYR